MFLVKKATKPLGIGSIVAVSKEKLDTYYKKKSGGFNDRLTGQRYIVLSKINSCDQKIIRVLNIHTLSTQDSNTIRFLTPKKLRLTFLALSAIEDAKQSYTSIFGESGKKDVQEDLLRVYGASISKI